MTDKVYRRNGGPWVARKYALTRPEAERVLSCQRVEKQLDVWRAKFGFPATDSPLARGKLLELLKACRK